MLSKHSETSDVLLELVARAIRSVPTIWKSSTKMLSQDPTPSPIDTAWRTVCVM